MEVENNENLDTAPVYMTLLPLRESDKRMRDNIRRGFSIIGNSYVNPEHGKIMVVKALFEGVVFDRWAYKH